MLIGIISDTHGYVDPRLKAAFAGVDAIVHAGDVGGMHVLEALRAMAPVHAVYGNNDEKKDTLGLRLREHFDLGGVRFHLVHQLPHARPEPGTQVVVFGHSHRTLIEDRAGVLHVNPGAAGRVGFHRVQTAVVMRTLRRSSNPKVPSPPGMVASRVAEARIVEIGAREPRRSSTRN